MVTAGRPIGRTVPARTKTAMLAKGVGVLTVVPAGWKKPVLRSWYPYEEGAKTKRSEEPNKRNETRLEVSPRLGKKKPCRKGGTPEGFKR